MSRDDILDAIEGFLTVFVVGFTAAVMSGTSYTAPNKWAIAVCTLGGLLAAIRKIQAHRAPGSGSNVIRSIIVIPFLALLLGGCAMPGSSFAGLDHTQIEAMAKIKDAAVVCVSGNYSIGRGLAVFASVDKGITATIDTSDDCAKIKIQTMVPEKK